MCGGLGPTHDDLTREAIAAVMGVELCQDDAVADVIANMFASRGRYMAANNLRQAMVPVGATIIPQTRGTAPGLICPVTIDGVDKVVYAVPGVPHEMKEMVERAVLPDLRRRSGDTGRDRQPHAAHVGRERERAQRAPRSADQPTRRGRQSDVGVSRERLGGSEDPTHRKGRDAG